MRSLFYSKKKFFSLEIRVLYQLSRRGVTSLRTGLVTSTLSRVFRFKQRIDWSEGLVKFLNNNVPRLWLGLLTTTFMTTFVVVETPFSSWPSYTLPGRVWTEFLGVWCDTMTSRCPNLFESPYATNGSLSTPLFYPILRNMEYKYCAKYRPVPEKDNFTLLPPLSCVNRICT